MPQGSFLARVIPAPLSGTRRSGARYPRCLAFLALAALVSGCYVAGPKMHFEAIAIDELQREREVISEEVEGHGCPDSGIRHVDYSSTTDRALLQAPGANALANAEFFSAEKGIKLCVKVIGEAVKE